MLARVLYQDPFTPVLHNSPPLSVSLEQVNYINEAIDVACSDSQFAAKLKSAIHYILTSGNSASAPEVTSLTPSSVVLGSPSFTLHVRGKNYTSGSIIVFAGQEEPTTFVSATEVTTGVNMSVWNGPDIVSVLVQNADGTMSVPSNFEFKSATGTTLTTDSKSGEKVLHKESPVVKEEVKEKK